MQHIYSAFKSPTLPYVVVVVVVIIRIFSHWILTWVTTLFTVLKESHWTFQVVEWPNHFWFERISVRAVDCWRLAPTQHMSVRCAGIVIINLVWFRVQFLSAHTCCTCRVLFSTWCHHVIGVTLLLFVLCSSRMPTLCCFHVNGSARLQHWQPLRPLGLVLLLLLHHMLKSWVSVAHLDRNKEVQLSTSASENNQSRQDLHAPPQL